MEVELKPCPFCGGTTLLMNKGSNCWITCNDCKAEGPYEIGQTEDEAITAWNRRATYRSY